MSPWVVRASAAQAHDVESLQTLEEEQVVHTHNVVHDSEMVGMVEKYVVQEAAADDHARSIRVRDYDLT